MKIKKPLVVGYKGEIGSFILNGLLWIYGDEMVKEIDLRAMHILFKPSQTPNRDDRKVGLFRKQFDDIWGKEIVDILSCSEVVWYANEIEHDKEMAIQQALIHRNLIVMGNMLDKCNGSTYIVKRVKELRDRILSGNKDMYGLIQKNPYLSDNLKEFVKRMECFDIDYYWE